ncbi:hypothetical protein KC946_01570 [Candidatus Saccharibacteria bacterium]|nr:hypothetical protein [Candidatus Saccharibacteria bacterium]
MFVPDIRKKEDIKFIFHVLEVHEGEPKLYREKLAYNRLCALYKQELDILLIPKYFADVEKEPITHMYARAYFKRWIQKPSSEWKLTYHGLDFNELLDSEIMAIDIMKKELKSMDNRYNYYKNKLKKK